jgi:hypothetical protein
VLDTTIHKQTQITLIRHDSSLQTTGGKDEPNIVFMRKSQRTSQHGSKNVNTPNRTKKKKKQNSNNNKKTTTNKTKRRKKINQKHNTICVGHHYTQTNTNNVNKT